MKKKLLSLALTAAIFTSLAAPAYATELTDGGTTSTAITGTIKATQLVVTVPATIAFQIDPTIDLTSQAAVEAGITTAQIIQTDSAKIVNGSAVPIYAKISSVAISQTAEVDDVTLVTAVSGLTAAKSMMFGIKATDDVPADFNTAANFLGKGAVTGSYLLSTDGKMDAKDTTDGSGADELTLKIFGQTQTGWAAGDTFTITPTITVSAKADFSAQS